MMVEDYIRKTTPLMHAVRIEFLCEKLGIPSPGETQRENDIGYLPGTRGTGDEVRTHFDSVPRNSRWQYGTRENPDETEYERTARERQEAEQDRWLREGYPSTSPERLSEREDMPYSLSPRDGQEASDFHDSRVEEYPYGRYVIYKGQRYELGATRPRLMEIRDGYDQMEVDLHKGIWAKRLGVDL